MFGAMFNVVDRIQTTVKRGYDQCLKEFIWAMFDNKNSASCVPSIFVQLISTSDQISSVVVKYMPIAGHQK